MRKIILYLAIAGVSLLTGCGESEPTRDAVRRQSPPSPLEYEKQVIKQLRERNAREGTGFDVKVEAERMRQKYNGLSDEAKIIEYNRVEAGY